LANFLRGLLQMTPHKFVPMSAEIWSVDHLYAGLVGMLSENWVRSECAALAALMGDYADCVVDSFNPLACIAARAAHKPLVSVIQADMHPLNRGFIWWREPPANVPSAAPAFNQVLAHYRLPPINKTEELFVGDLTLVVGMPETDPIPEPAQVTYIGPALWQAPDAALPDWCASLSTAKPIIWVYAGNPQYFAIQTPVDSVVVLPLPKNFIHAAYAPGIALARRSQLLIHHGGYGSCQTGLYAGTPAVIIPTYSERESNARRLAAAGAAEYILPRSDAWGRKHVAVDELREKINKTLREPTYAANAQRLGAQLQRYGGAALAAELIEATCTTEASAAG
jgi:UDP:flavonoid glycosyltransferase YjiC (YdhE family)